MGKVACPASSQVRLSSVQRARVRQIRKTSRRLIVWHTAASPVRVLLKGCRPAAVLRESKMSGARVDGPHYRFTVRLNDGGPTCEASR
jgi:hypothetical protein